MPSPLFATAPLRLLRPLAVAAALLAACPGYAANAAPPALADTGAEQAALQSLLAGQDDVLKIDGELLDADALRQLYRPHHWQPLWGDQADSLMEILGAADQEGLQPSRFHLRAIAHRRVDGADAKTRAEAELLLTDGVLRYASAMRGQRVDPRTIEDDWFLVPAPFDARPFVTAHEKDIVPALQSLQPPYAGYQLLRRQLAYLRAVAAAGGWPKVPMGPTLKPGAVDPRIPAVRRRLMATGELSADQPVTPVYDADLQAAVRLFQQRHGLTDDAELGRRSVAALDVSPRELAQQVVVNMERWRWLPPHLESNHIVVNVPAAWLEVVENGKAVLSMKTVVGDPKHPTPALHAQLRSLVINPTWHVPSSIATKEILPKLKKDPTYLLANDLEIVSSSFPPGSPESQGIGIDWSSRTTFPWSLRQSPGSDNALGHIKFNIPNQEDIYLHDTPNHHAFSRASRDLSHGCVRLENPDALALYLLRDKDWTQARLNQEVQQGDTHTVMISKAVPVWLFYWTMWVDTDGVLQIRDDIYDRDRRLEAALARPPSAKVEIVPKTSTQPQKVICEGCRIP